MTTRLMKASAVADTFTVERTRKPAKPAAKPAAPRKRAPREACGRDRSRLAAGRAGSRACRWWP